MGWANPGCKEGAGITDEGKIAGTEGEVVLAAFDWEYWVKRA